MSANPTTNKAKAAGGNSWARDMAESTATGGGSYIDRHGRYLFAVREVIDKTGENKGWKGDSITVRVEVIESSKLSSTQQEEAHGVGEVRSVVFNFTTDKKMARGKMKALSLALMGVKESEVTVDEMEEFGEFLVDPSQPLTGKLVKCETFEFTIGSGPNQGKKGVGCNWSHVKQSDEQQAELRAKMMGQG